MKCIVGLGNPGSRYRNTRHNVGFLAMEFLIAKLHAVFFESSELCECYKATIDDSTVLLLMPQTYMNNSGAAVREIQQKHTIEFNDILIIYDDFQLPFGTLRLRPKGSDGGHNGLGSIIYHLETDLVPRLRFGVGGATLPSDHTHDMMAEYVLSRFNAEEEKLLPELMLHTHDACMSWINSGIQKTMNTHNRNFLTSAGAE